MGQQASSSCISCCSGVHRDVENQEKFATGAGKKRFSAYQEHSVIDYHGLGMNLGKYDPTLVNGMIECVWPMIEEFAKIILKKEVEPAVQKALGKAKESFSVDMEGFGLGKEPVKMGKMNISQYVTGQAMKNLVIRTQVTWTGDMKAHVHLGSMRIGVSKIHLNGELLIELVGMNGEPPLFKGGHGGFVNRPWVQIEFDQSAGMAGKLLEFGPVKSAVTEVVLDQMSSRLVLPNCIAIRLQPSADIFDILLPRTVGILYLIPVKANDLLAMDMSLLQKGTSDPFVRVECGAVRADSDSVKETLNPTFSWQVRMPIYFPSEQVVNFEVWDKDKLSADDFLGRVEVGVPDLIKNSGKQETHAGKTYQLRDTEGAVGKNGSISVRAEWYPMEPAVTNAPVRDRLCVLFVGVGFADHVPVAGPGAKYWIHLQCTNRHGLGGHIIDKGLETPKKEHDPKQADQVGEEKVFERKKELCRRYKMSPSDMAEMLEVDESALDSAEVGSARRVTWNKPFEFLLDKPAEATLTLKLMHKPKNAQQGNLGRGATTAVKEDPVSPPSKKGFTEKITGAMHGVNLMEMLGTQVNQVLPADDQELTAWTIPVKDMLSNEKWVHTLTQEGSNHTLNVRFQVRWFGEMTDTLPS